MTYATEKYVQALEQRIFRLENAANIDAGGRVFEPGHYLVIAGNLVDNVVRYSSGDDYGNGPCWDDGWGNPFEDGENIPENNTLVRLVREDGE